MSKLKIIVNVVTILALAYLVYSSWGQIQDAFAQLKDLTLWLLLLQLPVQLLSYGAVAHLYYDYFRNTANLGKLTIKEMYKVSLELNFINRVFPTGVAMGFSYLGLRLRPFDINLASSTLAQSVRFVLTFISFLIILGLGLFLLAIDSGADDLIMSPGGHQFVRRNLILLLGGGVFFMVVTSTLLFIFLISSQKRIKEFVAWLPKAINRIVQTIHYKSKKELINIARVERVLEEIHFGYLKLRQSPKALKQPFFYALAVNFFELLIIYLVFLAFGEAVNPGAVILAYAIANFATLVAILPGGIGIYEALMVMVAVATGVDSGLALSATLVYRVFNILIFVPIGLVFYQSAIRGRMSSDVNQTTKSKGVLSHLRTFGRDRKTTKRTKKRSKAVKQRKDKKL